MTRAPLGPKVQTNSSILGNMFVKELIASSIVSFIVSDMISSSLQNTKSILSLMNSIKLSLCISTQNTSDKVIAFLPPDDLFNFAAYKKASLLVGLSHKYPSI